MNAAVITTPDSNEIYSDLARSMAKIEKELFGIKIQVFLKKVNSMPEQQKTVQHKQIIIELERLMPLRENSQFRHRITTLIDDFWDLEI